jgi:hypothetical protein
MKRLSDLPTEDRLTSRAQALIRAMAPTVKPEERLRRVPCSLDAYVARYPQGRYSELAKRALSGSKR